MLGSCQNVALGRIQLDRDVRDWISTALDLPGVRLLGLSPEIVVDSTRLPAPFHRDPADQLIVATSRVLNIPLLTQDARLLDYPFVEKAPAV